MSRILKIYFEKHPERLKEYNESKERYKNGESLTKIAKTNVYQDKRRQLTYSIQWGSKKDIQNFFDYIYKDATIFLKRKHDIFIELLGRPKTKPLKS